MAWNTSEAQWFYWDAMCENCEKAGRTHHGKRPDIMRSQRKPDLEYYDRKNYSSKPDGADKDESNYATEPNADTFLSAGEW